MFSLLLVFSGFGCAEISSPWQEYIWLEREVIHRIEVSQLDVHRALRDIRSTLAQAPREITWLKPDQYWIKINSNGSV